MLDMENKEEVKAAVSELIERADPERLEAAYRLFSLSEKNAILWGDALSLLIDTDYNIGTLKQAIAKIKDEQGLMIVRTRTTVRVFKYLRDEDRPDENYDYRAFYVKMITPEQKIAIGVGKAERMREALGSSFTEKDITADPAKIVEFIKSDSFVTLLVEPNKLMRKIVLENMVEVGVNDEGLPYLFPELKQLDSGKCEEFIFQALEEDLALLIEQQGILAKNSLLTDI